MAKLYYKYGTMNSGKSIDILKTQHSYTEQGKKVLMLTSVIDDRYGKGRVTSRIGVASDAYIVDDGTDIFGLVEKELEKELVYAVLIDEAQFLSESNVKHLVRVVDELNVPVIAYGLKNDFKNSLFEGSRSLLIYADVIEEIKSICKYCNKKATMNLRVNNGKPVYRGSQIKIGGNDSYEAVCRRHYYNRPNK